MGCHKATGASDDWGESEAGRGEGETRGHGDSNQVSDSPRPRVPVPPRQPYSECRIRPKITFASFLCGQLSSSAFGAGVAF